MDDTSSGRDKTRVPEQAASRGGRAALSSEAPAGSPPPIPRDDGAAPRVSEATIILPGPLRPGSDPASEAPPQNPDATVVGSPLLIEKNAAAIVSGDATIVSGPIIHRSPSPPGANGPGASAILLQIGTVLGGRYEVLELLGEGGMGAVYKAADREVDRVVALKVIRPEMASNPEILARFKQELHAHDVAIKGFGSHQIAHGHRDLHKLLKVNSRLNFTHLSVHRSILQIRPELQRTAILRPSC